MFGFGQSAAGGTLSTHQRVDLSNPISQDRRRWMADVETRPAVPEELAGQRNIAVMIGTGAVFGFVLAYVVGLILNVDWLLLLACFGLCVGGLCGVVVSRLMSQTGEVSPQPVRVLNPPA
jgi:hypothetical protein